MSVRFSQSCPTCGRRVEIAAPLLGRTVGCQHCSAEFVANPNADLIQTGGADALMSRVEQLLAQASDISASPLSPTEGAVGGASLNG